MELDITNFYNNAYPMDYSASVAEIGNNAGTDTWQAANDDSEDYMMLDTEENGLPCVNMSAHSGHGTLKK